MITDALFGIVFNVLNFALGFLPFMDLEFDTSFFQTMFDILKSISFFFPMGTVSSIFFMIVAIMSFRIIISLLKTIWQILPFV